VLGLGVSHPHLAERLRGHTFDRPLTRMREFLAAYRSAIYKGPMGEGVVEPPVLLAALRERMLRLAASEADGAFPYLVTSERVAWMRAVLNTSAAEAGRSRRPALAVSLPAVLEPDAAAARAAARAYLAPYLRTPAYQAAWEAQGFGPTDWEKPGTDGLVDAMVAWGDAEAIHGRIGEMMAAGADHVALIPLSPDGLTEHLPVLEALAAV
jgi:probable F420-dependent oxidoreductase